MPVAYYFILLNCQPSLNLISVLQAQISNWLLDISSYVSVRTSQTSHFWYWKFSFSYCSGWTPLIHPWILFFSYIHANPRSCLCALRNPESNLFTNLTATTLILITILSCRNYCSSLQINSASEPASTSLCLECFPRFQYDCHSFHFLM